MKPNVANILENKKEKRLFSESYNFFFNKQTGFFARWGKTQEEDPLFSPFGPEIADIEISTVCSGVSGVGVCKFCYKSNTPKGEYMSVETFGKLLEKLPPTITQVALGIGDITVANTFPIMQLCRDKGIVPNVTVNGEGITDEIADKLVSLCGAVAVSVYDREKSYNTVKMLTERGMKQVNIHYMLCNETASGALELILDRTLDKRLEKLNAIVFLGMKPKGRAKNKEYTPISADRFKRIVAWALKYKIGIGFDSCSAWKFLKAVEGSENYSAYEQLSEPCEATLFSSYINTEGMYFPCSFIEGENVENGGDWTKGIDAVNCDNFVNDVWNNIKTQKFRNKCLSCRDNKISCSHYNI